MPASDPGNGEGASTPPAQDVDAGSAAPSIGTDHRRTADEADLNDSLERELREIRSKKLRMEIELRKVEMQRIEEQLARCVHGHIP